MPAASLHRFSVHGSLCPNSGERRRHRRYALDLKVRYVFLTRAKEVSCGVGRVRNLSRSGVLIESPTPVVPGRKVRLVIDWPAKLDGHVPIQLHVSGKVVRASGCTAAAAIERLEFRTAASPPG